MMLTVKDNWERMFDWNIHGGLETLLPSALESARWYGGKARTVTTVRIHEIIPIRTDTHSMFMVFIAVAYTEGDDDVYTAILTASFGEQALRLQQAYPQAVWTELLITGRHGDQPGLLYDALWGQDHAVSLLQVILQKRVLQGEKGKLIASSASTVSPSLPEIAASKPSVMQGEQSNTSVRFGRHAMLKLYRRFESGLNPDLEIGRALTGSGYAHSPTVLGSLEYVGRDQQPATVAILHRFVENQGDAWRFTLNELEAELTDNSGPALHTRSSYAGAAALLGRRIAELHLALAQNTTDQALTPEPCTVEYWHLLRDRMTRSIEGSLTLLGNRLRELHENPQLATLLLESKTVLLSRVETPLNRNLQLDRIRCHGDFHLGQVLYTGQDFVIIDFEGEPLRPLAERRAKHVPLVDVAGMIRSFHYAASTVLDRIVSRQVSSADLSQSEQRITQWYRSTADAFLASYIETVGRATFIPRKSEDRNMLLDAYLIEKACYELSYELNNRPSWAKIPMKGLLQLIQTER